MQVTIREGRQSDRDKFWRATMETAWSDIPADEKEKLARPGFEEYFRQVAGPYLDDYRNKLFVAENERGEYVGHILLGHTIPFYAARPYGFVYDVYVAPAVRRQGIGVRLLEFAFKWCKEQGLDKVKLETAEHNDAARALYRKMGFKEERFVMGKVLA